MCMWRFPRNLYGYTGLYQGIFKAQTITLRVYLELDYVSLHVARLLIGVVAARLGVVNAKLRTSNPRNYCRNM